MAGPQILRGNKADQEGASSALVSAFAADPVMLWLMGHPNDPERRLRFMFDRLLAGELAKDDHALDVVAGGGGAALWHEVDDWRTPNREIVRMLPAVLRTFGTRLPKALRVLTMVEKVHPEDPHLYLSFIGVQRERQGEGLGGALMSAMTGRCDTEGLAAYLENSNPRNEAFYARHGFESRGPIALPSGTPTVTAMWRDPR